MNQRMGRQSRKAAGTVSHERYQAQPGRRLPRLSLIEFLDDKADNDRISPGAGRNFQPAPRYELPSSP